MFLKIKRVVVLGGLSLACASGAGWLLFGVQPSLIEARPVAIVMHSQQVPSQNLQVALLNLSLDAKSLTTVGVTPQQVGAVVGNVRNEMAANPNVVTVTQEATAQANQAVRELEHRIESGVGSSEDVLALGSARSSLQAAEAAEAQILDDLFNAGTFSLADEQRTKLSAIRANRETRTLPVEFMSSNRESAQWVALLAALSMERYALKRNLPVEPDAAAKLLEVRNEPAVSAALSALATHLTDVQAAWNASVAGGS